MYACVEGGVGWGVWGVRSLLSLPPSILDAGRRLETTSFLL